MELDFTKLNALTINTATAEPQTDYNKSLKVLQKHTNQHQAEAERAKEVYRQYQESRKKSGSLQNEILKGVTAKEDIYSLFLKAVEVIYLLTNNESFYNQIKSELKKERA